MSPERQRPVRRMSSDEARGLRERIVSARKPEWVGRSGCPEDWASAPCPRSARLYWKASMVSRGVFRKLNADRRAHWPGYDRDDHGRPLLGSLELARMREACTLLESAERTLVAERPRGMRLTRKGKWIPDDGIRVR